MATEPSNYTAETCDGFNVAFTIDTPSLFAGPITGLTAVSTPDYLLLIKSLVITTANSMSTFTCIPTVIPSVTTNQYYDLVLMRGPSSYQVPSFLTQPAEFAP